MYNEYGGYLPFELNRGREYYHALDEFNIKTNSGLTAIYCALEALKPTKIYIPHYICETVRGMIADMGIETERFYINSDFEPLLDENKVGATECVILVNYFGICGEVIAKHQSRFDRLIIDNTQAFFAQPVLREGVFNAYSCRKFVGTADGGYCISVSNANLQLERDYSSERYLSLMQQLERGTNYAYRANVEGYLAFKDERKAMSVMTEAVLASADYSRIIDSRVSNFRTMDAALGGVNRLNLSGREGVPYSYPLLVEDAEAIRAKLVAQKIYVPTIWKEKIADEYAGRVEFDFSRNILHLPVDQRYGAEDMLFIADAVKRGLDD